MRVDHAGGQPAAAGSGRHEWARLPLCHDEAGKREVGCPPEAVAEWNLF